MNGIELIKEYTDIIFFVRATEGKFNDFPNSFKIEKDKLEEVIVEKKYLDYEAKKVGRIDIGESLCDVDYLVFNVGIIYLYTVFENQLKELNKNEKLEMKYLILNAFKIKYKDYEGKYTGEKKKFYSFLLDLILFVDLGKILRNEIVHGNSCGKYSQDIKRKFEKKFNDHWDTTYNKNKDSNFIYEEFLDDIWRSSTYYPYSKDNSYMKKSKKYLNKYVFLGSDDKVEYNINIIAHLAQAQLVMLTILSYESVEELQKYIEEEDFLDENCESFKFLKA